MKDRYKNILILLLLTSLSILLLVVYRHYYHISYLTFSDGAKFADIARNIYKGLGYNGSFSFWSPEVLGIVQKSVFPSPWVPPMMPLIIFVYYKLFGVSDYTVILVSSTFFVFTIVSTFLLGNKIFGRLTGFIAAIAVTFNESLILYALSGASEPLFVFEIVFTTYLISQRKKWSNIVSIVFMILMYFTRPQGFIYIMSLILYFLILNFKIKKALIFFITVLLFGYLIDRFILSELSGRYFLYPILARGSYALTKITTSSSASDVLRGVAEKVTLISSIKKIFYNLYNFYKLIPQIFSPYLFSLYIISIFFWSKNKTINNFKVLSITSLLLTLVVTAISIPLYRYIHPVIPFVYLVSSGFLIEITKKIKGLSLVVKNNYEKISSVLILLLFCVGQLLGVIFLDSRFKSKLVNFDKKYTYVELARQMKENTDSNDLIITNLDTWGSWYGERNTVWYPIDPDMISLPPDMNNPIDAIYLTNYLIDDENYFMGDEWKQILNDPKNIKNEYISKNYVFKKSFRIDPREVYENREAYAVLLVKK